MSECVRVANPGWSGWLNKNLNDLFLNKPFKAKTMEDPNKKSDYRKLLFTILMAAALASVIAMYRIALPFIENRNDENIAVIAAIIFLVISYILAVKGGIPPSPPKTTDNLVTNKKVPTSPQSTGKPAKPGITGNQPKAKVSGGIPPAPRKDNP